MKPNKKTNTVRINAGEWRSRVLKFPDVDGLRPTPERVRQTVFNWLGQDLTGQTCLDLFAGTGIMGFEALSRHANAVTLVELSKPAHQALLQNKSLLNANQATLLQMDALSFVSNTQETFDVIFCDPPFNKGWIEKLLPLLAPLLKSDGKLYIEAEFELTDVQLTNLPIPMTLLKQKRAGNVYYHVLQVDSAKH